MRPEVATGTAGVEVEFGAAIEVEAAEVGVGQLH